MPRHWSYPGGKTTVTIRRRDLFGSTRSGSFRQGKRKEKEKHEIMGGGREDGRVRFGAAFFFLFLAFGLCGIWAVVLFNS
jgi:hypothetical protein